MPQLLALKVVTLLLSAVNKPQASFIFSTPKPILSKSLAPLRHHRRLPMILSAVKNLLNEVQARQMAISKLNLLSCTLKTKIFCKPATRAKIAHRYMPKNAKFGLSNCHLNFLSRRKLLCALKSTFQSKQLI